MNGGSIARVVLAVVVVAGLVLAGAGLYQAGFANGLAANIAADPDLAGRVVAPYGYGYPGWGGGWGFGGIFGILGFILFLFLIFALIRFALGGPRRWGGGPGWGGPGRGSPQGFRGSPWEERAREVHDEWHRRGEEGSGTDANRPVSTNTA